MPPAGDSPPPAALCPHTLPLCQAYEQLSRIGEGTYGVVMRCRHLASRELVAIKRFKETDSNEVSCRNGRVWGDAASFPAAPVWETGGSGGAVGLGGARQCPSNRPPTPPMADAVGARPCPNSAPHALLSIGYRRRRGVGGGHGAGGLGGKAKGRDRRPSRPAPPSAKKRADGAPPPTSLAPFTPTPSSPLPSPPPPPPPPPSPAASPQNFPARGARPGRPGPRPRGGAAGPVLAGGAAAPGAGGEGGEEGAREMEKRGGEGMGRAKSKDGGHL